MQNTARNLREIVAQAVAQLKKISDKEASVQPMPNKWSKKEILGHLIDSAGNNQQKFVRLMEVHHLECTGYNQDFWVMVQRYNFYPWNKLIALWELQNDHLAHIIEYAMLDRLQNQIVINGTGPFTLEFIMKDYIEHLKHHLNQVLPNAGIDSKFMNIYNS